MSDDEKKVDLSALEPFPEAARFEQAVSAITARVLEKKVDLSALEPFPSPARFEQAVGAIAARAMAARRRKRETVSEQLSAWARPALALAAGVALIAWVPSLWSRSPSSTAVSSSASQQSADPAATLMGWAAKDALPTDTTEVLTTLGGSHGGTAR